MGRGLYSPPTLLSAPREGPAAQGDPQPGLNTCPDESHHYLRPVHLSPLRKGALQPRERVQGPAAMQTDSSGRVSSRGSSSLHGGESRRAPSDGSPPNTATLVPEHTHTCHAHTQHTPLTQPTCTCTSVPAHTLPLSFQWGKRSQRHLSEGLRADSPSLLGSETVAGNTRWGQVHISWSRPTVHTPH